MKNKLTRLTTVVAGAMLVMSMGACSSLSSSATAADPKAEFPGKDPVTIIMGYTAGGSSDLLVRALVPFLSKELGTQVIVENKVGAGGQVSLTQLSTAPKDGHTIGLTNLPSSLAYINPDKKATYNKDSFQPLAGINRFRGILAVSKDKPWKDLAELVTAAKAAPGTLTVGVDGLTGDDHIAALSFMEKTGTKFKVVPFDGGSEKLNALLGGQIDISLGTVPTFKAQLDTGAVKSLAALDERPIPGFESVRTAKDQGFDVMWESFNVLSAPAGVPDKVKQTLEDAISRACAAAAKDPAFTKQMEAGGYVFGYQDAAWAQKTWNDLDAKWQTLIPQARAQK
jgi:tripartite-type tricarboxylate transporter receptor subunit TctC